MHVTLHNIYIKQKRSEGLGSSFLNASSLGEEWLQELDLVLHNCLHSLPLKEKVWKEKWVGGADIRIPQRGTKKREPARKNT